MSRAHVSMRGMSTTTLLRYVKAARVSGKEISARTSEGPAGSQQHVDPRGVPVESMQEHGTVAPTHPQLRAMGTCGLR
jgi:hypothetical protein